MFNIKSITDLSKALDALKAEFNEAEHPRASEGQSNGGQFVSGGSGSVSKRNPEEKETPEADSRGKNEVSDIRGDDKEIISREIGALYDYSLHNRGKNRVIRYADVTPIEAEKIKDATNLDVEGYEHAIDSDFIRHVDSGHGDSQVELRKGQEAVTNDDIRRVPEIVSNPDGIEHGVTKQGKDAIVYVKRFSGTVYYVEEVRTGRKQLAAITMYKQKAGAPRADSL